MPSRTTYDVIVVGAGPTGLLLAGDLATAGVRVAILEKRLDGSSLTRAFAVHARTLEHLATRGLADALVETGHQVDALRLFGSVQVRLDGLPSRFPFVLITPQHHVERLLLERAMAAGAHLESGATVTDLTQDPDEVTVTYRSSAGARGRLWARYVVGADGHHSTVRELLGLPFPGRAVVRSLILADVRLADPPTDVLTVVGNREGFCFVVPYGDGWFRLIARDPRREPSSDVPVTLEEIRAVAQRVLGTDHGMHSPRWMSRFHSEERQVTDYRRGGVFLAGDAAHVHSPAGGMGMNTGLQDAANLGWKLARVITGRAGEELLDSYAAERKPVGRTVVRTSGAMIRGSLLRGATTRAARDTILRIALRVPPIATRGALRVSGIGLGYRAPHGQPRMVGDRAPDFVDREGRSLHDSIVEGTFTLVAPEVVGRRYSSPPWLRTFQPAQPVTPMLVRPDGHIAWTGPVGPGLESALDQWDLRESEPSPCPMTGDASGAPRDAVEGITR